MQYEYVVRKKFWAHSVELNLKIYLCVFKSFIWLLLDWIINGVGLKRTPDRISARFNLDSGVDRTFKAGEYTAQELRAALLRQGAHRVEWSAEDGPQVAPLRAHQRQAERAHQAAQQAQNKRSHHRLESEHIRLRQAEDHVWNVRRVGRLRWDLWQWQHWDRLRRHCRTHSHTDHSQSNQFY